MSFVMRGLWLAVGILVAAIFVGVATGAFLALNGVIVSN